MDLSAFFQSDSLQYPLWSCSGLFSSCSFSPCRFPGLLAVLLTFRPFVLHCPFVFYRCFSSGFYQILFLKPLICEPPIPSKKKKKKMKTF